MQLARHGARRSRLAPAHAGTLIAECTAITEYLDTLAGPATLTGTTPLEKGVIHMMSQRDRALRAISYFDAVLKTQPFIACDTFSMADITVIGAFIFAAIVKLPVPAEHEALHAWYARMQERASVQAWQRMVEQGGMAAAT